MPVRPAVRIRTYDRITIPYRTDTERNERKVYQMDAELLCIPRATTSVNESLRLRGLILKLRHSIG